MKKIRLLVAPLFSVAFLASCGNPKPNPTIYHTIKFVGTDCYMIDDIGGQISEKQFEAGQTASYHLVGKTDEYEIPKENNVDITYTKTGKKFDGTFSYDENDGAISVKMTDDITVTAHSDKLPEYDVTIPAIEGLTINESTVIKGRKFAAVISVDTATTNAVLPYELTKVTCGENDIPLTAVTYDPNDTHTEANFEIPAEYTLGKINISFDLINSKYFVTEDEFNDALSFKDVEYLQIERKAKENAVDPSLVIEMSPTISHTMESSDSYSEIFVAKYDDGYDKYSRTSKEGDYVLDAGEPSDLLTPQSDEINLLKIFESFDLSYDDFEFNNENKTYEVTYTPANSIEITDSITFENKKVTALVSTTKENEGGEITTYSYDEEDPTLPVVPDPWYLDQSYLSNLTESNVGETKTIRVNGIDHTVRLIGIDHDDLASGNGKAHTTWEFSNLISDKDGNCITTTWNRDPANNYDFANSALRKALDGKGDAKTKVLEWYQKGATAKSEIYSGKTVMDMLPRKLKSALKTVTKKYTKYNTTTSQYEPATYDTQLFTFSYSELKNNQTPDEGSTYKFYKDSMLATAAVHKQVNNAGVYRQTSVITDGSITNYAGYNYNAYDSGGAPYWLRLIYTSDATKVSAISEQGARQPQIAVNAFGLAVAPVFCL